MAENSKSTWIWLGCGCATIVGALIAVVAFFGIQTVKTMSDPVARHDKALNYLTAAALPAGYETDIAMKVPFLAELVILQGDDAQFVYLGNLRSEADLAAAFADDESFDREIRRAGVKIRRSQTLLARDTLRLGQAEVRFVLLDGHLDFEATNSTHLDFDLGELVAEEDDVDAQISAVVLLRCSADDEPGLGLWAGPRAEAISGNNGIEDATADQAALRAFVEQFGFCPG